MRRRDAQPQGFQPSSGPTMDLHTSSTAKRVVGLVERVGCTRLGGTSLDSWLATTAVWFALLLLAFTPVVQARPLATLTLEITGQGMTVTPSALAVPKGIPGSVGVAIRGQVPQDAFVEAYLRGPSFPARRLVGAPNKPLLLPPLNLVGEYSLDGLRLVTPSGSTVLEAVPRSVPVQVFDEVLVSRVTSRPLSLSEIEERGIDIDESNFRAVEFEVGFVIEGGETIGSASPWWHRTSGRPPRSFRRRSWRSDCGGPRRSTRSWPRMWRFLRSWLA